MAVTGFHCWFQHGLLDYLTSLHLGLFICEVKKIILLCFFFFKGKICVLRLKGGAHNNLYSISDKNAYFNPMEVAIKPKSKVIV